MANRGGNKKKVPDPSNDTAPSSGPTSLKFTLPARRNNTESVTLVPPIVEPDMVIQPPSPIWSPPASPSAIKTLPNSLDESMDQDVDVEFLSIQRPETSPVNLLENFFTLEDSQEETETSTPVTQKPKQSKKSLSAQAKAELDEKFQRAILLIPQSSGASHKRKTLSAKVSYEEALSVIYETIGCEGVKRKPDLSYKLSDAAQKATPVGLECEDDWEGLCEEVVLLFDQTFNCSQMTRIFSKYMKSLRAQGKGTAPLRGGKAKLGKKLALIDLDNDDEEEDDAGDDSLLDKEQKFHEQLEKVLTRCQLCGPTKFCLISRNGDHVNLTFQQRCGWIAALAHGMHGVTLQTPPQSDLFADFHGLAAAKKVDTPLAMTNTVTAPVTPMSMFPYMLPSPWFAPPSFPYGHGNPAASFPVTPLIATPTRAEKHDLPSSDPPDDAFLEPYPEIDAFLKKLAITNPKRKLSIYIEVFENHDYYNVDDIANISLERLMANPFHMTPGNAEFLLKEIGREMKRVNQIRKKDHKRRRYY